MATIANSKAPIYIESLSAFQGSNLRAEWNNGVYEVYSYRTLMASFDPRNGDQFINPNKYSVTTSKHMNYVRRGFETIGR